MTVLNDFSWKVAGQAGHGILNAGLMFARTCLRGGLNVFATAEYPSLIRGGHNHLDVRVSDQKAHAHTSDLKMLVALNMDAVTLHKDKLVEGAGIIYDGTELKLDAKDYPGIRLYPIPLLEIANQNGGRIMRNTVAMGASIALADFDLQLFNEVLRDNFGKKKGEKVVNGNINAAKAGYDYIKNNFSNDFRFRLKRVDDAEKQILISGNEAISIGAIKAGCKFFAAYPMTPASSILHTMAANEREYNIVVKHTEDEISAVNMAIGASFAGVRSMTSTSGGGFALMVEGFGLAAQTETPLVIVEAQRPGPATGMATHSGQGDLNFVLSAGTDEFPRIVIAPGDVDQCYYKTIEAFNLAEKYQLPVVILTDKYLGESYSCTQKFSDNVVIDRGKLVKEEELKNDYKRYKITKDGVSPRAIPGQKGGEFVASSYEHDEEGFEREEPETRIAMHDKRFRKIDQVKKEVKDQPVVGNGYSDITIISWGSTKGPILDAIRLLEEDGIHVNFLQIIYMSPFPTEQVTDVIKDAKRSLIIENNKTSQLGGLIKKHTGLGVEHELLKYDGRPFSPEQIHKSVKEIVEGSRTVMDSVEKAISQQNLTRER